MVFNKHGSFYIRASWPMKGLMAINANPTIFTPQNEREAIDILGIGKVMVTSLRYWLVAIGIAEEGRDNLSRIELNPTELGKRILKHDKYFQKIGTAWLLHRNLAKNEDKATTWYWFFNKFNRKAFTKEEFLEDLKAFISVNGVTVAKSSLERDFSCLKNTYETEKFHDISNYIEEGIISYFSRLNLIKEESKNLYRKLNPISKQLPAEIILFSIIDDMGEGLKKQSQININDLFEKDKYAGKVFNLSYSLLIEKLDEMEKLGYIKVFSRFGHNHIEIFEKDKYKILENYYRKDI